MVWPHLFSGITKNAGFGHYDIMSILDRARVTDRELPYGTWVLYNKYYNTAKTE